MLFIRKYPKVIKVIFKPNFISNIPNNTEINQVNRLSVFFQKNEWT